MVVRYFIVPGKPYAKKRHRIGTIGGKGRAFNPKENVTAEGAIGNIAARHFPAPIMGPVAVDVVATFAIPKSWSKKKSAAHMGEPHCQKPDGDNILKAVKDALNRIAWADDGQVYDARVTKVWSDTDATRIIVTGKDQ